jgi:hypothetical protein
VKVKGGIILSSYDAGKAMAGNCSTCSERVFGRRPTTTQSVDPVTMSAWVFGGQLGSFERHPTGTSAGQ